MANHINEEEIPAGLSPLGQNVLLEVRNSWMKNKPKYAYVRCPGPENEPGPNVRRIPSWNTQVADMSTQDLFNTYHINRPQDFCQEPKDSFRPINCEVLQAQRQTICYEPDQDLQKFYRSHNESNASQLEPSGVFAQKSSACTQKSIMLFDDNDNVDQQEIRNANYRPGNSINKLNIEDEDLFSSGVGETDSPPLDVDTGPNSPQFDFQPVGFDSQGNVNNPLAHLTNTVTFKVPTAPAVNRIHCGSASSSTRGFHSSGEHWQRENKQRTDVYTSASNCLLPTKNSWGQEREFNPMVRHIPNTSDQNFLMSFHPVNGGCENNPSMSDGRAGWNYDKVNREFNPWEPAVEIKEYPADLAPKLNLGSDSNKGPLIEEPTKESMQSSPCVNTGVDMVFISELMYKLNKLAKEQEAAEMNLRLVNDSNNIVDDANVDLATKDAGVIDKKQEKPLPNFYVFKPPMKRAMSGSEVNGKVRKLDSKLDSAGETDKQRGNSTDEVRGCGKENFQSRNRCDDVKIDKTKSKQVKSTEIPAGKYSENNFLGETKQNNAKEIIRTDSKDKLEIIIVTEKSLCEMEEQLSTCELDEVTLTIMYKEGVSQLDAKQGVTLTPRGLLLGLSTADGTRYCFLRDLQSPWIPAATINRFLSLLFSRPCSKICVDAQAIFMYLIDKFKFSQEQVCNGEWRFVDPLVGAWLLDPDHPSSDFLSLVTAHLGKQNSLSDGREERACRLLELLSRTTAAVSTALRQASLYTLFTEMEMKLVPVLAVMELRGIAVDTNKLRKMQAILESRLSEVSAQAYRAAGRKFSLNSPVQLRALLYDELHLDKGLRIKSTAALGAKSTAEPMLLLLAPLHALPALVLRHRQLSKIKAPYVDAMLEHSNNGTIYTSWEQTGCATGRITSNSPNVQTIPRAPVSLYPEQQEPNADGFLHLRSVFVPRCGFALVSADFCQVELRLFAHFAQDETLLHAFRQQGDIFQHLAALWLGQEVKDEDRARQREKTKRVVYAVMYGAGAIKLSEFLQVSVQQASAIVDSFLGLVPALRKFPQRVVEQCRQRGFLRSLSGRVRKFPHIVSTHPVARKQAERQAINFIIQGSAADVCKAAMLATERCLRENAHLGARLLLQIHDELVWEVPRCHVQRFKELISEVMQDTDALCGEMGPLSVGLPVSVSAGDSWADMS